MRKRILALLLSITMVLPTGMTVAAEQSNENIDLQIEEEQGEQEEQEEQQESSESEIEIINIERKNEPQAGDTVWIKSGSMIYKSTEATEGYRVLVGHKIKITSILDDENGNPAWYEFEFQEWESLLPMLKAYSYIKAEDTAASEEDANSKECNCEKPAENLADHPDECPRKQYVKSLITNENGDYKTAKEIYADWDNYDEETQTDILNLLDRYVTTTYSALTEILKGFCFETFEGTLEDGVSVTVSAGVGAFPEGTTMQVTKKDVEKSQIENLISENAEILKTVAADIDFGCQPEKSVSVSIDISDEEMPENANMYYVIHMGIDGPELVTSAYLNSTGKGQTIPFTAESFSTYVVVLVHNKYQAKLMREVLKEDTRYTVKTLKANLFDYDAAKLNRKLLDAGENKGFVFPAVGFQDTIYKGINLGGSAAKQGILQNTLQNGLPVFNYLGENGGTETGKILFDPTFKVEGKKIYENVDFEFIYDKTNGYYTYNSAWNHAQLNAEKKTVELYADTLSMANEFTATADLSQAYLTNQMENVSGSLNSFQSTIKTDDTPDPFVCFPVSAAADKVQNVRVRAKIKQTKGEDFSSAFTIYFSKEGSEGYREDQTITATYTTSGDEWIDFVFNTEECSGWNGTINGIRLDPIQDSTSKNKEFTFEVAWIQLDVKNNAGTDYRNGGYYPFSDISESVPGRAGQFNLDIWKNNLASEDRETAFASRAIFNTDGDKQAHLAFGTVIEQEFYIPVSRKTDSDEDIQFAFTGDDDLWVFVDDELVLDIGGGHTPVTSTINFTEDRSWVEQAVTVTGYDTPTKEENVSQKLVEFDEGYFKPGMHTLKIFYMERHSGVSNCLMKFNLPLVPNGSVVVSKAVQDSNGTALDALKNETFTFQISGEMINQTGTALNFANLSYRVFDTVTNNTTTKQTNEKGQFTLTATQKAYFDIPENYKVKVEEITPLKTEAESGYQWKSVDVTLKKNGEVQSQASKEITLQKGDSYQYAFVNIYEPLYGNLTIAKQGITSSDQQSSLFRLEGTSVTGEKISLELVIAGNASKTIWHIPVGNYTVTEITDWSWRYELNNIAVKNDKKPEINLDEKKITFDLTSAGEQVTFTNTLNDNNWLSGDTYCKNWWNTEGTVENSSSAPENH